MSTEEEIVPNRTCRKCKSTFDADWKAGPYCGRSTTQQPPSYQPPKNDEYDENDEYSEQPPNVWFLLPLLMGFVGRALKVSYNEAAPSTFIGASNFFELSVALILFGMNSGATLAPVVGVRTEVPVMLTLVKIMKANRRKFNFKT
jgi:hypothetical protein